MFAGFMKQAETLRLRKQLARVGLFSDLKPRELRIIDGLLHERSYLAGEVIFDEGEEGQALYIILEGRVLICRQGDPEGGRIAELGAGDFFGDLALLGDAPRAAQARAAAACRLAVFFRADFMSLLETHAAIASRVSLRLARQLGERLRGMNRKALGARI
ncbi:MAG: hypothetical protein Fur0039_03390 [Rhodocyclaceae bacterium]